MPLDLEHLDPQARALLIALGAQYGSDLTERQAVRTLTAFERFGPSLALFGFTADDATRLRDASTQLGTMTASRTTARVARRQGTQRGVAAVRTAKGLRRRSRDILKVSAARLEAQPDATAHETARAIHAVLAETHASGASTVLLTTQLQALHGMLSRREVAAVSDARGGSAVLPLLVSAVEALQAVTVRRAAPGGTPAETEMMDLLDGIIVELVRDARRAARTAADALGQPALAEAFELSELYPVARGGGGGEPEPEPGPGPAPTPKPAPEG